MFQSEESSSDHTMFFISKFKQTRTHDSDIDLSHKRYHYKKIISFSVQTPGLRDLRSYFIKLCLEELFIKFKTGIFEKVAAMTKVKGWIWMLQDSKRWIYQIDGKAPTILSKTNMRVVRALVPSSMKSNCGEFCPKKDKGSMPFKNKDLGPNWNLFGQTIIKGNLNLEKFFLVGNAKDKSSHDNKINWTSKQEFKYSPCNLCAFY